MVFGVLQRRSFLLQTRFHLVFHSTTRSFLCHFEPLYFDPNFLPVLEKKVGKGKLKAAVTFILAHEISHYLYELYIENSKDRLSPFKNISLRKTPQLPTLELSSVTFSEDPEEFASQQAEKTREVVVQFSVLHAEVDAWALAIMIEMGESVDGVALVASYDVMIEIIKEFTKEQNRKRQEARKVQGKKKDIIDIVFEKINEKTRPMQVYDPIIRRGSVKATLKKNKFTK